MNDTAVKLESNTATNNDACCDDCREPLPHVDERVIEELLAEEIEEPCRPKNLSTS